MPSLSGQPWVSGRPERRGRAREPSVCFVQTPCPDLADDRLEPPLGLLYLATVVRDRGHRTEIVDLSSVAEAQLDAHVPDGYDVYGFSTYSVTYARTCRVAARVRQRNPAALVVAGGPHATALPSQVAADGFDVVVTGEGEIAMGQILDDLAGGRPLPRVLRGTPPEPLDGLPLPDYGLVRLASYSRQVAGNRCVSLLTSRGCPYRCIFCNSNIMGAGRPIRFRSPENVGTEIRRLKAEGIGHFRMQDDVFTINLRRVKELTAVLSGEGIVYRCFGRVNTCTPEMARTLSAGGCVHVSFGVETGSPKLLGRHAMNKGQTPVHIRSALENAHRAGLRSRIYLMVGFPGETDETIDETLRLVKGCPWDEFSVYPLIAYPGTPLFERPADFGITHVDRDYSSYLQVGRDRRAGFTLRTRDFDERFK